MFMLFGVEDELETDLLYNSVTIKNIKKERACAYQGLEMLVFRKILRTYLMDDS